MTTELYQGSKYAKCIEKEGEMQRQPGVCGKNVRIHCLDAGVCTAEIFLGWRAFVWEDEVIRDQRHGSLYRVYIGCTILSVYV